MDPAELEDAVSKMTEFYEGAGWDPMDIQAARPHDISGVNSLHLSMMTTPDDIREFDAVAAVNAGIGDTQVADPRNPTGFEEVYIKNASRACASCVGHCCRAFELGFDPSQMPDLLAKGRVRLRELKLALAFLCAGGRMKGLKQTDVVMILPDEKRRDLVSRLKRHVVSQQDEIYSIKFFMTRLRPARNLEFHPDFASMSDDRKRRICRCVEFDEKSLRCKVHHLRPSICRKYICAPASAGFVPKHDNMLFGRIQTSKKEHRNGKRLAGSKGAPQVVAQ